MKYSLVKDTLQLVRISHPIELVRDIIETNVNSLINSSNTINDLRLWIQKAWDDMAEDDIDHLISPIGKQMSVKVKGLVNRTVRSKTDRVAFQEL